MMMKFNTAVLIRYNRDILETHATNTINPQNFAINTANIVSVLRTDTNSLVVNTNATITKSPEYPKFPVTETYYVAPLTYTIVFASEAKRDRIFNQLINDN